MPLQGRAKRSPTQSPKRPDPETLSLEGVRRAKRTDSRTQGKKIPRALRRGNPQGPGQVSQHKARKARPQGTQSREFLEGMERAPVGR